MKKFVLIFVLAVSVSGCNGYSMVSRYIENPIAIDGRSEDWNWKLKYFEKEKFAVGISEDDDNVYICLATADRSNIMKVIRFGLTVWIEPGNEKGEAIGIQYPIKSAAENPGKFSEPTKPVKNKDMIKNMINKVQLTQTEYLVINENDFPLGAYSLRDESGAEIALGYDTGKLVYEIKIPKQRRKYFPLNLTSVENGSLVLRFKTNKPSTVNVVGTSPRRGTGNEKMRRGRGMRGQMGKSNKLISPLDFEVEVKLIE